MRHLYWKGRIKTAPICRQYHCLCKQSRGRYQKTKQKQKNTKKLRAKKIVFLYIGINQYKIELQNNITGSQNINLLGVNLMKHL